MDRLTQVFKTKLQLLNLLILLGLILLLGWFYWFQWRPTEIRKQCYGENFRKNEYNYEWAEGKEWMPLPGESSAGMHGWLYSDWEHRNERVVAYQNCLFRRGLK